MSPNCEEYPWDSHRNYICTGEEESKSSDTNLLVFSENCSDLSSISDISAGSAPETDGSAYKRRKLYGNTVALLSEENTITTKLSAYNYNIGSDDNHCTENKNNLGVAPIIYINGCSIDPLDKASAKASNSDLEKSAKKHAANLNGTCSSSKGNVECSSAFMNMKTEVNDAGESSDVVKEPLEKFSSVKEMCIFVLKSHGLLGRGWNPSAHCSESPCSNDANLPQPCKICGHLEDPLKLLICDLCEEAFHPSCCNPKVKDLSVDDWYCQPCFRKKPKPFLQTSAEKSFNIKDGKYDHRKRSYRDLISLMLKDTEPYATDVRIGRDFQVELPDWSGPNSIDHDYFGEPSEMNPTEFTDLQEWHSEKAKSFGNWIQCQEVVDTDENGQDIICGKWRRAPLFLEQTEDWDCSCAVTWDPIHADCAVPQELATSEVLKHLKFVEKVNARLAAGKLQKANETWPRSS